MCHDEVSVGAESFPAEGWSASSRCGPNGGNCVQVNLGLQNVVAVRDGKRPDTDGLVFGSRVWRVFLAAAGIGRFDH